MNVDYKHKLYTASHAAWKKARDFIAGSARVIPYIKTLPGHDDDTAKAFSERAYYLPAIARSVDAFTGLIMNPEPVIQVPPALNEYLDDVSYDGEPARRMIGRTAREVIEVGRCAIMVDYPQAKGAEQLTVAQAEALGLRAYARLYTTENVIDWRVTTRGGERILSFLKLYETVSEVSATDEWTVTEVEQIRVLDLVPVSQGSSEFKYRQRIYRKGDVKDEATGKPMLAWTQAGDDIFPMAGNKNLDEIPAVVFGPDSLDVTEIDAPPIMEMVEIAGAWLNNSALMEWALVWVSNPTPVFINMHLADGESVQLGSSKGISVGEGGDAKFLYLPAEGVGAIDKQMENKRRDMAAVGARLLSDETSAQISRDTAIIQRAGEHSVLANIATTVADGWRRVLQYLAMWAGSPDADISVTLNTDFIPQGMTPGELSELISAVQAGKLSSRDLFALLQKRGVVRPDKTYDEHQDELDEDGERMLSLPPGAPGGAPVVPQANGQDDNADNNPDDGGQQ